MCVLVCAFLGGRSLSLLLCILICGIVVCVCVCDDDDDQENLLLRKCCIVSSSSSYGARARAPTNAKWAGLKRFWWARKQQIRASES